MKFLTRKLSGLDDAVAGEKCSDQGQNLTSRNLWALAEEGELAGDPVCRASVASTDLLSDFQGLREEVRREVREVRRSLGALQGTMAELMQELRSAAPTPGSPKSPRSRRNSRSVRLRFEGRPMSSPTGRSSLMALEACAAGAADEGGDTFSCGLVWGGGDAGSHGDGPGDGGGAALAECAVDAGQGPEAANLAAEGPAPSSSGPLADAESGGAATPRPGAAEPTAPTPSPGDVDDAEGTGGGAGSEVTPERREDEWAPGGGGIRIGRASSMVRARLDAHGPGPGRPWSSFSSRSSSRQGAQRPLGEDAAGAESAGALAGAPRAKRGCEADGAVPADAPPSGLAGDGPAAWAYRPVVPDAGESEAAASTA
jgi:hypothetical protein